MSDTGITSFQYSLGFWVIKTIHDNTGRWLVVNNKTGEEHTAYSYRSAHFLCDLFNDQSKWFEYKNGGFITTIGLDGTGPSFSIYNHAKANWRFYFGDSRDTFFQFYIKNPPNLIQRWFIKKLVGITWEPVK